MVGTGMRLPRSPSRSALQTVHARGGLRDWAKGIGIECRMLVWLQTHLLVQESTQWVNACMVWIQQMSLKLQTYLGSSDESDVALSAL